MHRLARNRPCGVLPRPAAAPSPSRLPLPLRGGDSLLLFLPLPPTPPSSPAVSCAWRCSRVVHETLLAAQRCRGTVVCMAGLDSLLPFFPRFPFLILTLGLYLIPLSFFFFNSFFVSSVTALVLWVCTAALSLLAVGCVHNFYPFACFFFSFLKDNAFV